MSFSESESERSRSSSISSAGTWESIKIRKHFKPWVLYKFTSNWDYILTTIGCTFTVHNFFTLAHMRDKVNRPTIIHHIISFVTVGLPICYMQTLIGQYSQLGVILFKHMSPIGHGVGYAYLMSSFVWCCYFGIMMGDFFMYLLACIDSVLSWMRCPPGSKDHCWGSISNCTEGCINETVYMSSFVYWKEKYMNNVNLNPTTLTAGNPMPARFIPIFITWALIYAIVSTGIDKYKKLVQLNIYLAFIMLIILTLVCFTTSGSGRGVALMFRLNVASFFSISAWSRAIYNVIKALALGRACHMTFGTYMTHTMVSDVLSVFSVLVNFILTLMGSIISHASLGIILAASGIKDTEIQYIWRDGTQPFFTILTQGIGFMGVPQLWSIIYFLTFILILTNNLVTQVDVLERSIADAHTRIRSYRNYMLATICILCAAVGFLFSSGEFFVISEHIFRRVVPKVDCFNVFIMSVLAFWVYRVQRISDDIHFLHGFQPTKYWKICWYIMPFYVAIPFVRYTFLAYAKYSSVFRTLHRIAHILLTSPIPIFMGYEILRYLTIHNLVGLVQPEERWGPPDPQERYLRLLFNPRQEIRSRRRDDTCQHKCLLSSKILKKIVSEEDDLRDVYLSELEGENEETSAETSGSSGSSSSTE